MRKLAALTILFCGSASPAPRQPKFLARRDYGSANCGPCGLAAAADLNGDGVQDIVTASYATFRILLGNGNGTFGAPRSFPAGANPFSLAAADFNVIAAGKFILPVVFPPRDVVVHSAGAIVVVRRHFLQLREHAPPIASDRIH